MVGLQALEDVHKERSHRDIKAGNVMVSGWDSGQELKLHLIDWANSRLHDEGQQTHSLPVRMYRMGQQQLFSHDAS